MQQQEHFLWSIICDLASRSRSPEPPLVLLCWSPFYWKGDIQEYVDYCFFLSMWTCVAINDHFFSCKFLLGHQNELLNHDHLIRDVEQEITLEANLFYCNLYKQTFLFPTDFVGGLKNGVCPSVCLCVHPNSLLAR